MENWAQIWDAQCEEEEEEGDRSSGGPEAKSRHFPHGKSRVFVSLSRENPQPKMMQPKPSGWFQVIKQRVMDTNCLPGVLGLTKKLLPQEEQPQTTSEREISVLGQTKLELPPLSIWDNSAPNPRNCSQSTFLYKRAV